MLQLRLLFICCLWMSVLAKAQIAMQDFNSFSNLHNKIIAVSSDTIMVDSISLFPNSFFIRDVKTNEFIDKENYTLDFTTGKLIFKNGYKPDSVLLTFRTFPIHLAKVVQHKNPKLIRKADS